MPTLNRPTVQEQTNNLVEGNMWKYLGKDVEDMDIFQQKEVLDEIEDMDIDELDLEGIERACSKKYKDYVPQEQVCLLKAILKDKSSTSLGINLGSFKERKKIVEDCGRKPGRK